MDLREFRIDTDIINDRYGDSIKFELYYRFERDKKRSKKAYYCAAERVVEKIDDDGLGFSASLPDGDSFIVLLCSKYFDDNVSDDRNGLDGLAGLRSRNMYCPILLSDIKSCLKQEINTIILEAYPTVADIVKETKVRAINETPYLAKYIRNNEDTLVTENSLIKEAKKQFNVAKETAKSKFEKLLKDADINIEALSLSVGEVSEIAVFELGEYIQYREKIIKALDSTILDTSKREEFIHNIFMPKGTSVESTDESSDYSMTNLWLLDDKFMSFSYAASDKQFKKVFEEISAENAKRGVGSMEVKKPDMTVIYKNDAIKDALIVDFKGLSATLGEKEKAIGELGRNVGILNKSIGNIPIWGYIITTIDDEFEMSLLGSGYKRMFSNAEDGKIYHFYNDSFNAHLYAVDMKAITADALARNKTFLDILKKMSA